MSRPSLWLLYVLVPAALAVTLPLLALAPVLLFWGAGAYLLLERGTS